MAGMSEYRKKTDPSHDDYDISEWPFYNLVRLTATYHQKMDAALKPLGADMPYWRVLNILARQECATVTQISVEAVSKMSTMAKIIQRMAQQGFVTTRSSATDARAIEVMITDKGRDLLKLVHQKAGAIAQLAFYNITDEEIKSINQISRKILSNLS